MIDFHEPAGNFGDAIWTFLAKLELPNVTLKGSATYLKFTVSQRRDLKIT
jgi:hypothetical protein